MQLEAPEQAFDAPVPPKVAEVSEVSQTILMVEVGCIVRIFIISTVGSGYKAFRLVSKFSVTTAIVQKACLEHVHIF